MHNHITYPIILLVGPSGSGKTTIAEALAARYNMRIAKSYTTRPPRYDGEESYHFVSKEQFERLNLCDRTEFSGNLYGLPQEEIEKSDIIICDPNGVRNIRKHYSGNREIVEFYLNPSASLCYHRMLKRGDSEENANKRIENDASTFRRASWIADKVLDTNKSIYHILAEIEEFLVNRLLDTFAWRYNDCTYDQYVLPVGRNVYNFAQIISTNTGFRLATDIIDLTKISEQDLNDMMQTNFSLSVNEAVNNWTDKNARLAMARTVFELHSQEHDKSIIYTTKQEAKNALREYKAKNDIFDTDEDRAGWNNFVGEALRIGMTPDLVLAEVQNIANR